MKKTIITVIIAIALMSGGVAYYYFYYGNEAKLSFKIAQVQRGNIVLSINATGTVEPEEVVDVGAQVAGQILSFGKDEKGKDIDYGSYIKADTVLAEIDDSLYAADAAQANAQVEQAKAAIKHSEADLVLLKAQLYLAETNWKRAQKLYPSKVIAELDYDTAKSAYDAAVANIAVGETAILQARANLAQSEAYSRRANRNLSYCTIKSPVDGIVIDRRVNIGQTVVASLNAPSLFLIAKDLKRMQVWVAVNEADIGKIYPKQPVRFTVDAFSGETFAGEVGQIRLNASMTQNVVTYTVEVNTDNSTGKLLPYLTANVQFELKHRDNVLMIPSTAFRWIPSSEQIIPGFRGEFRKILAAPLVPGQKKNSETYLWIQQGKLLEPLKVRAGLSDGFMTEIEGDNVKEGTEIVSGQQQKLQASGMETNPFAPQLLRGGGGGGGRR